MLSATISEMIPVQEQNQEQGPPEYKNLFNNKPKKNMMKSLIVLIFCLVFMLLLLAISVTDLVYNSTVQNSTIQQTTFYVFAREGVTNNLISLLKKNSTRLSRYDFYKQI